MMRLQVPPFTLRPSPTLYFLHGGTFCHITEAYTKLCGERPIFCPLHIDRTDPSDLFYLFCSTKFRCIIEQYPCRTQLPIILVSVSYIYIELSGRRVFVLVVKDGALES